MARVEYYRGEALIFAGDVQMEAGEGEYRDMVIALSAPEAMANVELICRGERSFVRLGDREMESGAFSSITSAVGLLIPQGDALAVSRREISGDRYAVALFSSGVEIYFDLGSGLPVEARRGEERLVVRNFEIRR